MKSIINLNDEQKHLKPVAVVSGVYFLKFTDENWIEHKIPVSGEEQVFTFCPDCLQEHAIDRNFFTKVIEEYGVDNAMVCCEECTAIRATN